MSLVGPKKNKISAKQNQIPLAQIYITQIIPGYIYPLEK